MIKNAFFIKELPDGWEKAWKELWRDLPASNNLMYIPSQENPKMINAEPLYKISNRYQVAYEALFGNEDIPEEAINDTLSAIEEEFSDKAINVAALIKNIEAQAAQIKEAEKAMNERKNSFEKRAKNLRKYLLDNLKCLPKDKQKIFSPQFQISLKDNPAAVLIDGGAKLSDEYMRIIPEEKQPDKIKLKAALEGGKEIEGVSLVRGISLVIK